MTININRLKKSNWTRDRHISCSHSPYQLNHPQWLNQHFSFALFPSLTCKQGPNLRCGKFRSIKCLNNYFGYCYQHIRVAQRKRGGPITHRSLDRNQALIKRVASSVAFLTTWTLYWYWRVEIPVEHGVNDISPMKEKNPIREIKNTLTKHIVKREDRR